MEDSEDASVSTMLLVSGFATGSVKILSRGVTAHLLRGQVRIE